MDGHERRQLPRWQVKREAKVWLPQTQEFGLCFVEDINLKGLRASFNKRLPQEQTLKLSLVLEDNSDFMKIEAQIPWFKEEQGRWVYGLSFSKIMEWDKDKIYQYINTYCYDQIKGKWWA